MIHHFTEKKTIFTGIRVRAGPPQHRIAGRRSLIEPAQAVIKNFDMGTAKVVLGAVGCLGAVGAVLIAVFGHGYVSSIQQQLTSLDKKLTITNEKLKALDDKIDEKFTSISTKIDEKFTSINTKIDTNHKIQSQKNDTVLFELGRLAGGLEAAGVLGPAKKV